MACTPPEEIKAAALTTSYLNNVIELPAILLLIIGHCLLCMHRADKLYRSFNDKEWKIDGLPWPVYWVRFLNANVGD